MGEKEGRREMESSHGKMMRPFMGIVPSQSSGWGKLDKHKDFLKMLQKEKEGLDELFTGSDDFGSHREGHEDFIAQYTADFDRLMGKHLPPPPSGPRKRGRPRNYGACIVDECMEPIYRVGLCKQHFRKQEYAMEKASNATKKCVYSKECNSAVHRRYLCKKHYSLEMGHAYRYEDRKRSLKQGTAQKYDIRQDDSTPVNSSSPPCDTQDHIEGEEDGNNVHNGWGRWKLLEMPQ